LRTQHTNSELPQLNSSYITLSIGKHLNQSNNRHVFTACLWTLYVAVIRHQSKQTHW